MEWVFNKFGYFKRKKRQYRKIMYAQPGTPTENGRRLIELTVQGNEWARNKDDNDYKLIGMFFTIVLLIEHKIGNLLVSIDTHIEDRMLGEKITIFKDFLKIYEGEDDEEINEYKFLLQPLNEIKTIRNSMAHDITQPSFNYQALIQVDSYVKKRRPDLYEKIKFCDDEKTKCIGLLAIFGFVFSFEIAKLRLHIEY